MLRNIHCFTAACLRKSSHHCKQRSQITLLATSFLVSLCFRNCYLADTKTLIQKETQTTVFIVLFTIAKVGKQPKYPQTNEWTKKLYVYTVGYYSTIKKDKLMPFAVTWIELEGIMLAEICQKGKDKGGLTYMWNIEILNKRSRKSQN